MSFISSIDQEILSVPTFQDLPSASLNSQRIFSVATFGVNGGALFFSDGSYWRPVNGSCVLGYGSGSRTFPIATLPGPALGTYFPFTLPSQIIIPQGLIYPGSSIEIKARIAGVSGSGGQCYLDVYLDDGVTPARITASTRAMSSGVTNQYDAFYRVGFPAVDTAVGGFFRNWFFNRSAASAYSDILSVPFSSQDIELKLVLGIQVISASSIYGLVNYAITFKG